MDIFFELYDLPNWVFGLLTVSTFIAFSMLGLWLSRRLVIRFIGNHLSNDIVSFYLAAVGVFYGITLGLIAVGTYTSFSAADNIAAQEAAAVGALYRDVDNYLTDDGKKLGRLIKEYVRVVAEEVWIAQQHGTFNSSDVAMLNEINKAMLEVHPDTENLKIAHTEALRQFNNLLQLNTLRIQSAKSGLPITMYVVIIIGALLNIMVSWLFVIDNFRLHSLLNIIMAGLLGLLVYLIAVMDYPYRGKYNIKPDGLDFVWNEIIKEKIHLKIEKNE